MKGKDSMIGSTIPKMMRPKMARPSAPAPFGRDGVMPLSGPRPNVVKRGKAKRISGPRSGRR